MAGLEALAFDMYGTLVDPIRIWKRLAQHLPDEAVRVAEVWRGKQLEYTFRLAAMERYEEFRSVTRRALDYALAVVGRDLSAEQKDSLIAQYDDLERFADVEPGLRALQAVGYPMVVFSNGSPSMLDAIVDASGLRPFFTAIVSVDDVRTYKPSPRVYRHLASRLDRPPNQVRLVSSNPFDVIGAAAIGMRTAWVDRSGGLFDTLGERPALVVPTLSMLAGRLTADRG